MSKSKLRSMFAKVVCVTARSGIIVALYLAAFLGAFGLAAVLPEPWSAVGVTGLLLVVGLALLGRWPAANPAWSPLGLATSQADRPILCRLWQPRRRVSRRYPGQLQTGLSVG